MTDNRLETLRYLNATNLGLTCTQGRELLAEVDRLRAAQKQMTATNELDTQTGPRDTPALELTRAVGSPSPAVPVGPANRLIREGEQPPYPRAHPLPTRNTTPETPR